MGSASSADLLPDTPRGKTLDVRRRRQLIDATIRAIASHGLSGTTVARVARLAGLSTGIVNFYFQSKDALLLATLQTVDGEFAERQGEALERAGDDPVRQLEAMIEVDFDPAVSSPERIAVWNAFWGEARAREDYMRICGRREREDAGRAAELFGRIARGGGYRQLDPNALGRAFYHLLSSLPEEMLDRSSSFDPEAAKAICRSFLTSVFPVEFGARRGGSAREAGSLPRGGPSPLRRTLPAWAYRDPELHALEMQTIFRRHWLLVGHVSELAEPGAYLTLEVGEERALVIRGADGGLRGFHNVCRHRASPLVGGVAGRCEGALVCPAHGWRYELDGRLAEVPGSESLPGVDRSRLDLPALEVAEWMGFVYLRFEAGGPELRAQMRPFDAQARLHRLTEMGSWGRRWTRCADFDWKLFAESQAEAPGLPGGRSGMSQLLEAGAAEFPPAGPLWCRSCPLRQVESPRWSERMYQRLLRSLEPPPATVPPAWAHFHIFPAAVIAVGPDRVDACQVLPLGPQRCRIQGFSLALPDERRPLRAARYLRTRIARRVLADQLETCAGIAAGLASSSYRGGTLSELDSGVGRFQERIRELVPVTQMEQAPPPGSARACNEERRARG